MGHSNQSIGKQRETHETSKERRDLPHTVKLSHKINSDFLSETREAKRQWVSLYVLKEKSPSKTFTFSKNYLSRVKEKRRHLQINKHWECLLLVTCPRSTTGSPSCQNKGHWQSLDPLEGVSTLGKVTA